MSFTPTTTIGQRLAERWKPWLTDDLARVAEAIGTMCEPLAEIIEEEGYPDEEGWVPGYGKIFNPETCPEAFLGYLGMFVGVPIPAGTPEAEARALIKAESGLARGTEASVKAAIERGISRFWMPDTEYLKGQLVRHESTPGSLLCYEVTKTFTSSATFPAIHPYLTEVNIAEYYDLIPRTEPSGVSNPYWFLVVINGANLLPENNPAQLESYVNGAKPAGLKWEAVITDEAVWDEATLTWNEVGAGVIWSTVTKAQIT
jgi:hypothetical protein